MSFIYHIADAATWKAALENGLYEHPSLQTEGFIHCCEERQLSGVLSRYFEGKTELAMLKIDTLLLVQKPIYEHSPSLNEDFPHIYGPINTGAVVDVVYL